MAKKSRKKALPKRKAIVSKRDKLAKAKSRATGAKTANKIRPRVSKKQRTRTSKENHKLSKTQASKQLTLVQLRKQARELDILRTSKLSRTSLTRKINLAKKKLEKEKLARKLAREARIKARERAQRAAARALAKKQEAFEYERKRIVRNARAKARRAALKLLELSRRGAEVIPPAPISSEEALTEEIPPSQPPSEPIVPVLPETAPISEREVRAKEILEQIEKANKKLELAKEKQEQTQHKIDSWIEQNKPEYFISIIDGSIKQRPSRARTDSNAGDWYQRLQEFPEGSKGWVATIEA